VKGDNIVGCEYSAKGNNLFQTFDPIRNLHNPTFFKEATMDEVLEAVSLADQSFIELQSISHIKRADFLAEIANEIELLGKELIDCFTAESGFNHERAESERKRTINQLRAFSDLVRKNEWIEASIDLSDNLSQPPKPDIRKMYFGIGPVVVFGASNFPLAYSTAGGDTAAAFAAGCPVIVKSHPMHAGTGELVSLAVVRAAIKTEMPKGVFSNLNAIGFEVAQKLVQHTKVKAVAFTGSITGGRALFDLANSRPEPIPVFAEMGSSNPVIILPDGLVENVEQWSSMFASSITTGSGQFCTKPGLIFLIDSPISDQFIAKLSTKMLATQSSPMVHPAIIDKFELKKRERLVFGEDMILEKEGNIPLNFGRQALLVVKGEIFQANQLLQEEVFGPFSLIIKCVNSEEMVRCVSMLHGQLTGSIFGTDFEFVENSKLISILKQKVGRIIFNGVPTGVTVCASMHHGGPYPASTDSRFTAVGIDSISRFSRPIVFQNCPQELLPHGLKNVNSLNISRKINGKWSTDSIF
jgi:2,5-dioxopentanoate dehydrogenase